MYFLSLLSFFSSNSLLFFWFFMELNLISTCWVFWSLQETQFSKSQFKKCIFFYYLIQALGSMVFLSSIAMKSSYMEFDGHLMAISLTLKLGLFPFFFWILKISKFITIPIFMVVLVLQKIPLSSLCFSEVLSPEFLLTLFSSFIFSSILIFFSSNLLDLLIFSSTASLYWILFLYTDSLFTFLFFYLIYFTSIFFLLKTWPSGGGYVFFLLIGGLAPFSMFFFKFLVSYYIYMHHSTLEFACMWIFSFVGLMAYLKFFYFSFFSLSKLYNFKDSMYLKNVFYYFMFFFFFSIL